MHARELQHAHRGRRGLVILASAGLALAAARGVADEVPAPYAPLAPLVGEWTVGPPGAAPAFIERFTWGPGHAYLWTEVTLLRPSGERHLHFEGMVVWNGATKRFDYLYVVEPGSMNQESGTIRVEPDGTLVREVLMTAADGATSVFRQTFRMLEADRAETSLMRRIGDAWAPTFPGSERLVMLRGAETG